MSLTIKKVNGIGNEFHQNTYIIEFEDCCVVIDAGTHVDEIKQLTNKPIAAVLITHGHYDHVIQIESYQNNNIPIYAHKDIEKMLSNPYMNASHLFGENIVFNINDIKYVENETININNKEIKCIHTPGHSLDSMSYLIDNQLFSGDTLFATSIGRTDLLCSKTSDIIESLKALSEQEYEILYAGHGRPSNKEEQQNNIKHWLTTLKR